MLKTLGVFPINYTVHNWDLVPFHISFRHTYNVPILKRAMCSKDKN